MKVHCVKKARKADPDNRIAIGDTYYWWKFHYGSKHKSKIYPKRSQLTQSSFLSSLWAAQDACDEAAGEAVTIGDFQSAIDCLKEELENLKDKCQSSFDNIPESLQEGSSSGQLLQQRIEQLDDYISSLDSVDLSELEELEDGDTDPCSDAITNACSSIVYEISSADPGVE